MRALLRLYPGIDVLAQNEFGKSISSEAFAKNDAALVELILQHSSAAKLDPAERGESGKIEEEVTHAFQFSEDANAPIVRVRELGELGAEDHGRILGKSADDDRTGLQLGGVDCAHALAVSVACSPFTPHMRTHRRWRVTDVLFSLSLCVFACTVFT